MTEVSIKTNITDLKVLLLSLIIFTPFKLPMCSATSSHRPLLECSAHLSDAGNPWLYLLYGLGQLCIFDCPKAMHSPLSQTDAKPKPVTT